MFLGLQQIVSAYEFPIPIWSHKIPKTLAKYYRLHFMDKEARKPTSLTFRFLTYKTEVITHAANLSSLPKRANKMMDGRVPEKLENI